MSLRHWALLLGASSSRGHLAEPGWGVHLTDVNIGLGNLLRVVKRQTRAYVR